MNTSTNTNANGPDPRDAADTGGNTNAAAADQNQGYTGEVLPVWPRSKVNTPTDKGADAVTTSTNTDGQDPRDAAVTVDNTTAAAADPNTAHAGEMLAVLQICFNQGLLLGDLHAHSLEDDDGHTLSDVIAHQNTPAPACGVKQWDKAGWTYKCEQCPARMTSIVKPPWPTSPLKHSQCSVISTDRPGLIWPAASPPPAMSVNPSALAPAQPSATAGLPTSIILGHTGPSPPTLRAQPPADGKLPVRNPPPWSG